MIKAVLLDLDNTLLHNPDRQWVQTFRSGWDQHFEEGYGISRASEALRSAIGRLNENGDSCRSNAELLQESLCGRLALSCAEFRRALDEFYAGPYHSFRRTTAPVKGAAALVEALLDHNLLVAIATNPLFPEAATIARLEWRAWATTSLTLLSSPTARTCIL